MSKPMRPTYRNWLLLLAVLTLFVGGFFFESYQKSHSKLAEKVGVGITGYNFTNEGVQEFYVNEAYGSNLPSYGGGGATSCCVSVPAQWTPDLRVTVDWTIGHYDLPIEKILAMTDDEGHAHFVKRTLSKKVPVERYERPGGVQVFFLPNDEIKIYSFDSGPQDPDHPSKMGYPRDPNKQQEQKQ